MDPEDNRLEGLKWFVAMLIQHETERGNNQAKIGDELGRDKGQVSLLRSGSSGMGLSTWLLIADWQNRNPGEMLDEALNWWAAVGPAWRDAHQEKLAENRKRPRGVRRKGQPKKSTTVETSAGASSLPPASQSAHQDASRGVQRPKRVDPKRAGNK